MAHDWLDIMVKDEVYRGHIDIKALRRENRTLELEGPVGLDVILWALQQGVKVRVTTPGA